MRIIAGPCQHESYVQSAEIATECKRICDKYDIEYIFKASYDKANRSSMQGKRGMGMEATLTDFLALKVTLGVKTLTDVHDYVQVAHIEREFKDAVDVYQIPAFLCRQTDLLQAVCATDKIVNIKKGQFLAPWDMAGILTKTEGAKEVWITERGTSFGYNTLVVDFTGLDYMLTNYSNPIVLDATHSVQKPGGLGGSSGGNRNYVPSLCRAGSALGIRDFFLEVHTDPDNAPSDGPNMLHLKDFEDVVKDIYNISKAV
jgi:2-dehydro-3-deoxyphosphooctonate aldolase (KDO 8-P synthase)|tara:strand:- start:13331 stop:14104 length:774 start_codon:yes stop_codon:yes gene_type:complete